jgi:hypothetical protein
MNVPMVRLTSLTHSGGCGCKLAPSWRGTDHGDAHIAIQEAQNGKVVDWMEKVSDEQYRA